MTESSFIIRAARLPEEAPALVSFVDGLQLYEHAFEPNRRTDDRVAQEYFDVLTRRVAEHDGRIYVAERDSVLVGWLVSLIEEHSIYVREDERRTGYIVELYVAPEARRGGIATALARAATDNFRARGLKTVMIGVLPGNPGAKAAYESWGFTPYSLELRKRL